jgi:hypothetical protein
MPRCIGSPMYRRRPSVTRATLTRGHACIKTSTCHVIVPLCAKQAST